MPKILNNSQIKVDSDKKRRTELSEYNNNVVFINKPVYDVVKRIFDIVFSIILLIILSPLFICVIIAILIDDFGPVLFKQTRIGINGKNFTIYKFRSMRVDAEQMKNSLMSLNQGHGANFELRHDPRRTRVGKFIRRTSIDELPQLINIIKGDMSIVGPRPFVPEEQANLPKDRLYVNPGLSCYWQISGKNLLNVEQQIALDRKYIKERSIVTDIKIIIKTIGVVIWKDNR